MTLEESSNPIKLKFYIINIWLQRLFKTEISYQNVLSFVFENASQKLFSMQKMLIDL